MGRIHFADEGSPAEPALDVTGWDLDDLFVTAARALAELMIDPATLPRDVERKVSLVASRPDLLLHDWLGELIFRKDRDREIFPETDVRVTRDAGWRLAARLEGGVIDPARTVLRRDAKAVTFHQFVVERAEGGWRARVIVDI